MEYGSWKSKMDFPPVNSSIFFDIETDIDCKYVWLIGCKYHNEEIQFLGKNFSEEYQILSDFAYYLKKNPNIPLICYSTTNFDFRILWNAASRLKLPKLHDQLKNRSLIDLGTLLKRHFQPFGKSYSLKMIRYLIGYKYANEEISGADVAIQYYRETKKHGKISPEFQRKALSYNLDDVRIMHKIISKFEDNINFSEKYSLTKEAIQKINVKNIISSYVISDNYIRISCLKDKSLELKQILLSSGFPLPTEKHGINITALYWSSNFSFHRAKDACDNIGLNRS